VGSADLLSKVCGFSVGGMPKSRRPKKQACATSIVAFDWRALLMPGHVVPKKLYILVFVALILFTGLTTGVAFVNLGKWNTVVALAIAVGKASLVVLFFMHLRWSSSLMRMVLLSAFVWFAILVTLTLSDEFTRQWTPLPSSWEAQIHQEVR
jgi:cytochrome c oxidase subunit 4